MDELVIVLVGGVEDGFKEFRVSICAANILRWTSTLGCPPHPK
jgi:hypothetical protein